MKLALKQAEWAFEAGEIPVGALVVSEGQIISRAYNQVEKLNDPTAHAEMIAITSAANFLSSKYLIECTLYVTLEPCSMCKGAIHEAQINKVVFGAFDNSHTHSGVKRTLDPQCLAGGVMENECEQLLRDFFNRIREK